MCQTRTSKAFQEARTLAGTFLLDADTKQDIEGLVKGYEDQAASNRSLNATLRAAGQKQGPDGEWGWQPPG